ncbi:MAG TPA: hypothetical protein VFG35_07505 [Actinoplanes sp.]|nr:hypothetical protein [Actinoplanes sp.]
MPISKIEVYLLKYARSVVAAGRSNVDRIVTGILALHGPGAIDPARTRAEILGQCALLDRSMDEQRTRGEVMDQELAEDILARQDRDTKGAQLRDVMVAVRGEARECFDPESLRIYRLDEPIPESHEGLARYAGSMMTLLEQNPRTGATVLGKPVTAAELAAPVTPALESYRGALDNVAREARETELARVRRDESEARFRRVLHNVAAILAGYLRLAGLDELADRIRPTRVRAAGAADPELPGDVLP